MMDNFDYIIVGAGSAGCVLADRLSESGRSRVLVLENGPMDRSLWIHLPAGYGRLFHHEKLNYRYETEPQPSLGGRKGYWPRGRVVGGSGAINAMVYCRGLPRDFDDWEKSGATGWNWRTAKETFDRLETKVASDGSLEGSGKIYVSDVSQRLHPLNERYFSGLNEIQLPRCEDMNGSDPEGGTAHRTNTFRGRRWSAAQGFLKPALRRKNLELLTNAQVRRVLLNERRAVGVEVSWKGVTHIITSKQIILSAGAIGSPTLLQSSGIGPASLLAEHGVELVRDNAHVGANLQDHIAINYFYEANEPSLNNDLSTLPGKVRAMLQYAVFRRGPLSTSINQCGGFFRSSQQHGAPDQQLYFNPVTYTTTQVGTRKIIDVDPFPGFVISSQPCRPTSLGKVEIRDLDPGSTPRIEPNALDTSHDLEAALAGSRLCARILNAPTFKRLIKRPVRGYPDLEALGEVEILEDFRNRCATVFHPTSTCRMGRDPDKSVVDPNLKVHGVDGLRVVDASAFPNITSGNTNAPTMMLAYRAADLILSEDS